MNEVNTINATFNSKKGLYEECRCIIKGFIPFPAQKHKVPSQKQQHIWTNIPPSSPSRRERRRHSCRPSQRLFIQPQRKPHTRLVKHPRDNIRQIKRQRQEYNIRHQERHLKTERPGLWQRENVDPTWNILHLSLCRPPHGRVQPITDCPEDRAMDHVKRIRHTAEVLAEGRLEKALQPADARSRDDEEHSRPRQIEPLVVVHRLWLEE